ncbi:MAG TPA: tRNA glutamyl-Q(34) synthetase GluQRS [Longimicrobium sp.]|nr:tRNA glutamyl-Q(34) synthetase GluQRS [Longimicrobium sp.]
MDHRVARFEGADELVRIGVGGGGIRAAAERDAAVTRGRFAPSPTGALHVGNARTALVAWLHARAAGGAFVVRVEDLDAGRVRPGIMETQLDELRWLGLDWDEGPDVGGPHAPYVQSARAEAYEAALRALAEAGALYECTCSRRDIAAAASAPHAGEEGPRYPGTCRGRRVDPSAPSLLRHGIAAVALRVVTPPGELCFDDLRMGRRCYDPAAETGDFVVRRKDGAAAYQLAVVVDDAAMAITHVVRGADLLSSTSRQLLLYEALGLPAPAFLHVPLVLGEDGERLAKRHGAVSLGELRARGVAPERVVGWLAATCGLAEAGEAVAARELVGRFEVGRLPTEPTVVTGEAIERLVG